jgi:hypothetical protein
VGRIAEVGCVNGIGKNHFLPDVDLEHGNLNYTVVLGEVLGNYESEQRP